MHRTDSGLQPELGLVCKPKPPKRVAKGIKPSKGSFRVWETGDVSSELIEASEEVTKYLGRKSSIRIFNTEGYNKMIEEGVQIIK